MLPRLPTGVVTGQAEAVGGPVFTPSPDGNAGVPW